MAAVPITINGVIVDMYGRTITGPVKIVGEAMLTGLGVGGGPMPPGEGAPPSGGEHPEHPIHYPWPGDPGFVGPGGKPPGIWGPTDPRPTPPIYIPPAVPPSMKPPEDPEPGSPTTSVPGNWPVQPVTPPPYVVFNYPGVGPVVVAPPAHEEAAPQPAK